MSRIALLVTQPKRPNSIGFYDWQQVSLRINRVRIQRIPVGGNRTLGVKELADRIGMEDSTLRKKLGGVTERGKKARTPFTVDECGQIARIYGAPMLWPFMDWEALEDLWKRKT